MPLNTSKCCTNFSYLLEIKKRVKTLFCSLSIKLALKIIVKLIAFVIQQIVLLAHFCFRLAATLFLGVYTLLQDRLNQ